MYKLVFIIKEKNSPTSLPRKVLPRQQHMDLIKGNVGTYSKKKGYHQVTYSLFPKVSLVHLPRM